MAEPVRIVRGRSASNLPRGLVVLALTLLSWMMLIGAWQALSLSFIHIVGN